MGSLRTGGIGGQTTKRIHAELFESGMTVMACQDDGGWLVLCSQIQKTLQMRGLLERH